MKFSWSRALYHAARWMLIGVVAGLFIGFILTLTGARRDMPALLSVAGFYICGFGRLAWDLFTKPHPDD